jgi:hypothetical protein
MRKSKNKIKLNIPQWVSTVYLFLAVVLVPWTIYLAISLPRRHVQPHWDVLWVGLDIGILILFLLTGVLASIKSRLVIISLSATASFLLVDSWFDIASAKAGYQFEQSLSLALFIEIPLAILGYYLAYRTLNKNID